MTADHNQAPAEGDERAAFEAWAPTVHMRTERWAVNPELYDDEAAISAWSGWSARATLAEFRPNQPQPKGTEPLCNGRRVEIEQVAKAIVLAAAECRAGVITFKERDERVSKLVDILAAPSSAQPKGTPAGLKAQALALCHTLEEQPGSQYQTAAVLAAFKVYRAFESIEKHGEIRQWVFDVAAPAVQAPQSAEAVEDLMTKIQAFGLACYQHESGAEQISMQDEIRIDLAALAGASSAWQPIETAPKDAQLLLAAEFDHPGDWRIKMGYFDSKTAKWAMWGASWRPTRWMRLPPGPGAAVQAPAPVAETDDKPKSTAYERDLELLIHDFARCALVGSPSEATLHQLDRLIDLVAHPTISRNLKSMRSQVTNPRPPLPPFACRRPSSEASQHQSKGTPVTHVLPLPKRIPPMPAVVEPAAHAVPSPAWERPESMRCAGCDLINGCPEFCRCKPAAPAAVELDLCQNCGDLAHPGCNSEFSAEPACRFWGPGAVQSPAVGETPSGFAHVSLADLADWRMRVNTMACLTVKAERHRAGADLKGRIADYIEAASQPPVHGMDQQP